MWKHWKRLWAAARCRYSPGHPLWPADRQSEWKGCAGEFLHALKNVYVEQFRLWGIELNPRRR